MVNLVKLKFNDKTVRCVRDQKTKKLYFCAKDIGNILGYKNAKKKNALQKLIKFLMLETKYFKLNTNGGKQTVLCIDSHDLNTLLMHSNTEEAKNLKFWISRVVLRYISDIGVFMDDDTYEKYKDVDTNDPDNIQLDIFDVYSSYESGSNYNKFITYEEYNRIQKRLFTYRDEIKKLVKDIKIRDNKINELTDEVDDLKNIIYDIKAKLSIR